MKKKGSQSASVEKKNPQQGFLQSPEMDFFFFADSLSPQKTCKFIGVYTSHFLPQEWDNNGGRPSSESLGRFFPQLSRAGIQSTLVALASLVIYQIRSPICEKTNTSFEKNQHNLCPHTPFWSQRGAREIGISLWKGSGPFAGVQKPASPCPIGLCALKAST
ncbi:uncharacterized protein TM35_000231010 [Trypanosoma theileri]|uniref:Uncharacterized protein n=1 Tax=Trypanosoma theileri TaxID=67003 RepID=A0A1X0NSN7_9TRYP|nr:uncharacterized protein TM35_000231010 [Trypanosoma theileri]ORC87130.1 hypothetical protein TM35_000231010 [Trypanosoma theileri]